MACIGFNKQDAVKALSRASLDLSAGVEAMQLLIVDSDSDDDDDRDDHVAAAADDDDDDDDGGGD